MGEVLIRAEGVSKKFCKDLRRSLWYGIQDLTGRSSRNELRPSEFWALKDVSFEVRRGECLGLIGHNGAGKSTLLKMLNGLIRPDAGRIEVKGRVGALIELGAGFNPILTGRENIYNNAAILGFNKKETDAKLDEIIEFSELGDFLDMPVQNYSSGMRVRLGFAVAAQMEPDVLIIDEVLAVGDMGFVLKCFNRMDKLLSKAALILVSHSMPQIARMSTQIMLLDKGQSLFYSDDVSEGITRYYNRFNLDIQDFVGSDKVLLKGMRISSGNRQFPENEEPVIEFEAPFNLHITVECLQPIRKPYIYLAFYDREMRNFAEVCNFDDKLQVDSCTGTVTFSVEISQLLLAQGKYSVSVFLSEEQDDGARQILFRYQSAIYFTVHSHIHGWAPVQFNPDWKISS